jgi:hypothetical protein
MREHLHETVEFVGGEFDGLRMKIPVETRPLYKLPTYDGYHTFRRRLGTNIYDHVSFDCWPQIAGAK